MLATGFALLTALAPFQATASSAPAVLWRDVRSEEVSAIDLVFLPDGFRSEEGDAFEASVKSALRQLESHPASFLRDERERWNVHVGFVPSAEACPADNGAAPGDTAFDTRLAALDAGGMFVSDDGALERAAHALAPGVDAVVVIVRARRQLHFATGDLPREGARIRLPEGMESVLLHELGHSLFALGDEYVGREFALPTSESGVVAFYPNVTRSGDGGRFVQLGLEPAPLEQGALDFRAGVFRAAGPCVMQDPGAERFCPPCAAVIRAGPSEAAPAPLEFELVAARPPQTAWRVELAPADRSPLVLRRFAVLFRLDAPADDEALRARFAAAEARLSHKTRYMDSAWLGDGSLPGEAVFSLEPQVTRCDLGQLAAGSYAFAAAQAGLRATSSVRIERFDVRAPSPR